MINEENWRYEIKFFDHRTYFKTSVLIEAINYLPSHPSLKTAFTRCCSHVYQSKNIFLISNARDFGLCLQALVMCTNIVFGPHCSDKNHTREIGFFICKNEISVEKNISSELRQFLHLPLFTFGHFTTLCMKGLIRNLFLMKKIS